MDNRLNTGVAPASIAGAGVAATAASMQIGVGMAMLFVGGIELIFAGFGLSLNYWIWHEFLKYYSNLDLGDWLGWMCLVFAYMVTWAFSLKMLTSKRLAPLMLVVFGGISVWSYSLLMSTSYFDKNDWLIVFAINLIQFIFLYQIYIRIIATKKWVPEIPVYVDNDPSWAFLGNWLRQNHNLFGAWTVFIFNLLLVWLFVLSPIFRALYTQGFIPETLYFLHIPAELPEHARKLLLKYI